MTLVVLCSLVSCRQPDKKHFTLTVSKTGNGIGNITAKPTGISCGNVCNYDYEEDITVILTADPYSGSDFTSWSGACSGATPTCSVKMNEAQKVTANFELQTRKLTITKNGSGSGSFALHSSSGYLGCNGSSCTADINYGEYVTLDAVPTTGSYFDGWTELCSGIKTSCSFSMYDEKNIAATFGLQSYVLSIVKTGNGSGVISSDLPGINCGTDCSEGYLFNTSVTLTAAPNAFSVLTGWSGACAGSGLTCTVSVNAIKNVTATFALEKLKLTVSKSGTGVGAIISVPGGINCGATCSADFDYNSKITLTATASTGSSFTGWSGPCTGTGQCAVTMIEVLSINATFTLNKYALTVVKAGNGSGLVSSLPTGIDCGSDCTEEYDYNTAITLTATPATGSNFTNWSGGCTGTAITCKVTMATAKTVTATFTLQSFTLTLNTRPGAGVIASMPSGISCWPDCSEAYNYGTEVNLESTSVNPYFIFDGWSDACSGTGPCMVTITGDTTVTANYMPDVKTQVPLNFSPYLNGQDPNRRSLISEQQMRDRLAIVKLYTNWVRFFGTADGLDKGCQIAHEMGFKVVASAWLGKNLTANEGEITNIINIANTCKPEIVVVGSEVLLRNDLTEAQLLSYISRVKSAIPAEIPVTTADIHSVLWDHPVVMEAVDIVFANFYPYWEGINLNVAAKALHAYYRHTVKLASGKQVVVSETGWPSCGNTIGTAIPSPENSAFHFKNIVSWSIANTDNPMVFYFEAFDELWKAAPEGPQGACWGLWEEDGVLKPGMHEVFAGAIMENNWDSEEIIGGPGIPSIAYTFVPCYNTYKNLVGQVLHINPFEYRVVVYIRVGSGWWTKPYWTKPLTSIGYDGTFVTDITTGGYDQQANTITAFLVPEGYTPPLMSGQSALPATLDENAVAKVSIVRGTSCPVIIP